mmetsp:Transcript_119367/g.207220  ORF Transcript_119367/g.207220 Transcript_119367/m.207220 type:complete len:143 (-) Transcript_119367:70-498(-)
MTKSKKPKYEHVQYLPPTPQVFGSSLPTDLPTLGPPKVSSFNVDRPRNRPKLQDRLAVYEDDNPQCQRMLCIFGVLLFPLWFVGAFMYLRTPTNKVLTREAGIKNLVMSCLAVVLLIAIGIGHFVWKGGGAGGQSADSSAGG